MDSRTSCNSTYFCQCSCSVSCITCDARGHGVARYPGGGSYEGEWEAGTQHGIGCSFHPSGGLYIGEHVHGRRSGHGLSIGPSGDVFAGDWLDDLPHGWGIMVWGGGHRTDFGKWEKGQLAFDETVDDLLRTLACY